VGRAIRAAWTIAGFALAVAGCCRGSSCDLKEPNPDGGDAGPDGGPVACGNEVCDMGFVCCVTTSPPLSQCVNPASFDSLGCQTNPPCFLPADCPAGMACCFMLSPDISTGTATCQQELQCLAGAMSYVACGSDADCPHARPTCTFVASTSRGNLSVCE
jgi:hypothetical protein